MGNVKPQIVQLPITAKWMRHRLPFAALPGLRAICQRASRAANVKEYASFRCCVQAMPHLEIEPAQRRTDKPEQREFGRAAVMR